MYTPTLADRVAGSAPLRRRRWGARLLARVLGRIEIVGLERVPRSGPVVLAVNHRDFLDGPLLFAYLSRPVNFLVKVEAYTPRAAPLLNGAGQIPVRRDGRDAAAVRFSLRLLRAGGVVGLFPEGGRGDGLVRTAKPGVGYFALRTGAVVVPVACHGTDSLKHRRLRRPAVRITFGAPIELGRVPDGERVTRRQVRAATEQVRSTLADLVAETAPDRRQAVAA
jgi:1-acyl-sn-glycerol-3-phosphate acyltransferase